MIVSRSEWGSYRYDGDADMKVLRSRAERAVRYFKTRDHSMEDHIFGCIISVIDNGKLSDNVNAYRGNVIHRSLKFRESGHYAGKMCLSYNDNYNDGRGQGGCGSTIIGNVTDVRIDGDYLVIEGTDLDKPKSYRYRIQEHPDTKPFVYPIPKGGKVPVPKTIAEAPRTPGLPELCEVLYDISLKVKKDGHWFVHPYTGKELPVLSQDELCSRLSDPSRSIEICDMFLDCYLSHYSEHWNEWGRYGITYDDWKKIESELRRIKSRSIPVVKPSGGSTKDPHPKEPAVVSPPRGPRKTPPKAPVKGKDVPKKASTDSQGKGRKASVSKAGQGRRIGTKGSITYEVRVDGMVEGAFSSKAKAETLKKQLKTSGKKARIFVVFT